MDMKHVWERWEIVVLEFLIEEATWKTKDEMGENITMDIKTNKFWKCWVRLGAWGQVTVLAGYIQDK